MIAQAWCLYPGADPVSGSYVMLFDETSDRVRTLALCRRGALCNAGRANQPLTIGDITRRCRAGGIMLNNRIRADSPLPRSLQIHLGSLEHIGSYLRDLYFPGAVLGALNSPPRTPTLFTPEHLAIAREVTSRWRWRFERPAV